MARIKHIKNFTTVSNEFIRSVDISFKAKGLFTYMTSFDDTWNFTIKSIATQSKDGYEGIKSAINELKDNGFMTYEKHQDGTGTYTMYDSPKTGNPFVENPIKVKPTRIKKNNSLRKTIHTDDDAHRVIKYLNIRTSKNYKADSKVNIKVIAARIKEGHTLEEFAHVIDVKIQEWTGTDMEKFLRPETLFGNKFDGYLQQKKVQTNKQEAEGVEYTW